MPSAGNDVGSASPRSLGGALQGPRSDPFALLVKCLHLVFVDLQSGGSDILFQVFDAGSSGDRQNCRRPPEQPGKRDLRRRGFPLLCQATKSALGTGGKRKPGDESRIVFLAIIQDIFRPAVRKAVAVLDTHNGHALGTVCLPARIGQGSPRKKEKRNNHTSDAIRKTWGKKSPFGRVWPYSLL